MRFQCRIIQCCVPLAENALLLATTFPDICSRKSPDRHRVWLQIMGNFAEFGSRTVGLQSCLHHFLSVRPWKKSHPAWCASPFPPLQSGDKTILFLPYRLRRMGRDGRGGRKQSCWQPTVPRALNAILHLHPGPSKVGFTASCSFQEETGIQKESNFPKVTLWNSATSAWALIFTELNQNVFEGRPHLQLLLLLQVHRWRQRDTSTG